MADSDFTSFLRYGIPSIQSSITQNEGCTRPKERFQVDRRSASLPTSSVDAEHSNSATDEFLVARTSDGDREALALLFRRYARMVRTVAQRILRDPGEAEDLLQEVFLFVFRRAALFDPGRGSARSWLVQVTYHRAFDRRRHLTARHFYTNLELEEAVLGGEEPRAGTSSYEQTLEGALGREALGRIEEALSEDQRRVLRLCFVEGYTLSEIAALLGQTPGNVRNHYYRALEKMRAQVFPAKLQEK
jgi:RNA polymerase sigma-70 factor, ECF subfamily